MALSCLGPVLLCIIALASPSTLIFTTEKAGTHKTQHAFVEQAVNFQLLDFLAFSSDIVYGDGKRICEVNGNCFFPYEKCFKSR